MRSTEQQVFDADGIDGIALRYGVFYGFPVQTLRDAHARYLDADVERQGRDGIAAMQAVGH